MAFLPLLLGVALFILAVRRVMADSGPVRVVLLTIGSATLMVAAAWMGLR